MQEEKENIEVQQDTVNKYENYINKYNRENKKTEISKYSIKIEDFEGPLDLLCFLVKKNKMNIDDINIYKIIEEYLEYMYIMESLNLEVATEFITMASMLIYLKSKKILPKSCDDKEEDEISEELLKEKIIQYKKYKQASIRLSSRYEEYNYRVSKKREELVLDKKEFEGLYTPYTLTRSYKLQILKFQMKENVNKDNIDRLVIKEKVSVKDKIKEMFTLLSKIPKFIFNTMFLNKNKSKDEIISAFLGILEMAKKNEIKIKQENIFSDILVEKSNEK